MNGVLSHAQVHICITKIPFLLNCTYTYLHNYQFLLLVMSVLSEFVLIRTKPTHASVIYLNVNYHRFFTGISAEKACCTQMIPRRIWYMDLTKFIAQDDSVN